MLKKMILLFILVGGLLSGYLFTQVPVLNINKLANSYVKNEYRNESIHYRIVHKRPRKWASLKALPKHVYYAFIVSEDWSFYNHQGVDLRQIYMAIKDHLNGEKLRGASTISQQLIKNLYTKSERSLQRKVFELFSTMYLENRLTKDKILETYLNIIEFGEGLYGITEASWFYFKKRPDDLNPKEAAFLAMLLPNPKVYSQSFRDKELTEFANKIVNSILNKLKVVKVITPEELDDYRDSNLSFEKTKVQSVKNKKQILEDEFFEL
ncbi:MULTISPECIES: biosynthetic peptidoglycan transglycosylase [Halobacteriovorax]|uniref:Glycosyl transferase family 51 domain-containing protein n=1 Tax=Halobacteriovorax vibrionivorans TaxID=2152716 RepID=A0ABY0IIK9_9BACT|nr:MULTISPECIES: biosynthetic peptidoglycan transglycosylase [Halobacteriovorax]AYF45761.1 transglycosylase [Halobacteriovorax sp. BALOs_7]RZF22799.1 hypothetical protein DAY19_03230 [Halobacteriovorax vibrionivorans]TGD45990.1 hypothetical protein EP118_13920 [Halobacteriovorax sp. Y22]